MNTFSTNRRKTLLEAFEEMQEVIAEEEELDFESLDFESRDDIFDDEEDYYYEPTEVEEWYDFDPDC